MHFLLIYTLSLSHKLALPVTHTRPLLLLSQNMTFSLSPLCLVQNFLAVFLSKQRIFSWEVI